MEESREYHFDTLAIHAAEQEDQNQALNSPIYMTSTFTFTDLQQAEDTFSFKRRAYVYTRGGNPTINLFEQRLATLENGVDGVAFSSGMAAISSVILSFSGAGDSVLAHRNLYGSTFGFLNHLIAKYGINTDFIDMTDLNNVERSITPNTRVMFLETPTNPALEIIDIEGLCAIAHSKGIKVVVDNTFATPVFQKPLDFGADVVLHSATKYISGHGDVVGGVATSKDFDYIQKLKFGYMCELGGVISPFSAWLLLRGMKTLGLRMERHERNATAIAEFLRKRKEIEKTSYPGFEDHPGHKLAARQMEGFGGIISFELCGPKENAEKFVQGLKLIKLAVSLGDAETLVEVPAMMTHRDYPEEELHRFGFSSKTVRISAGLEHHSDLLEDIEDALEKVYK
ncbi:methionine gamma-lyase [Mesotoga sp. Brook.08.YT.4.2.5.1]|uniref:trans-sulfuration enzyme family protein n=1 Tax=unclassified Mesotoga TaxID=1184398 RepID=UPI000C197855|nr:MULTISPECIES: PLP-dependent aspartate aminotransferase family protein [unclassified Mesotoga]MDD3461076.1 PLP-dependent aspartate aminotransferase family protein [Mesotoga sp.]PNQ05508.1 methionine gamma-lyase [Mesotoga sp. SC_NapDC3]RAM60253.1 methionine gamma-lyase [Mesotoga sp. SC_3PWM13N19]PNE19945.1 methionine gamma-lyase [Mesotoga sp. Brook.08.YT.4.2.5.1]PNS40412.1 methionine gamma-lyase [Mesotoga sp. B105.6.4]